ncbi:hypothetical protein B5P41_28825 [Bacillus sp. SRB_28]|nr:hypothetical protein B5P41_28825 [Bacillus sp. SRB_28]
MILLTLFLQNFSLLSKTLQQNPWCQKQNLPVHRLYYWLNKLSPETEDQNKNERVNWISMNVPVVEENIHDTIDNSRHRIPHFQYVIFSL